ncbi:STAS domain-containing protein [Kitasatospora sp. RB6PN24]|uniref:STAS domain-containing protein n=1 Tax=Kitasatospora humi TaxID=2893891 RepID=UPI001E4FE12D|nr:STAS domain-containing protein [Kitasatospora humi]MCC9305762.1 STAS domain-containing protein [Kitasatospora humi]
MSTTPHDRPPNAEDGPGRGLWITIEEVTDTAVICRLRGEVDQDQRPELQNVLAEAVQKGLPQVVVDLSGLTFSDSAGLNALLRCRGDASAAGTELVLASPPPQMRRLLEMTGADRVFTICDSVRAALPGPAPPADRKRP